MAADEGVADDMNKNADEEDGGGGASRDRTHHSRHGENGIEAPWPALRFDLHIPHPPAAVWRALTDPDLLARWWAAGEVKPVVGHRFTLDMGNWGTSPAR